MLAVYSYLLFQTNQLNNWRTGLLLNPIPNSSATIIADADQTTTPSSVNLSKSRLGKEVVLMSPGKAPDAPDHSALGQGDNKNIQAGKGTTSFGHGQTGNSRLQLLSRCCSRS